MISGKASNNLADIQATTSGLVDISVLSDRMKHLSHETNDQSSTIKLESEKGADTVSSTSAAVENTAVMFEKAYDGIVALQVQFNQLRIW